MYARTYEWKDTKKQKFGDCRYIDKTKRRLFILPPNQTPSREILRRCPLISPDNIAGYIILFQLWSCPIIPRATTSLYQQPRPAATCLCFDRRSFGGIGMFDLGRLLPFPPTPSAMVTIQRLYEDMEYGGYRYRKCGGGGGGVGRLQLINR